MPARQSEYLCSRPAGQCAMSLLTEVAGDYFELHPDANRAGTAEVPGSAELFGDLGQYEILHAAAAAMADFASALISGMHGRGCPVRREQDIADLTASRGLTPCCATCGAPIHIFRDLAGWHHFRGEGTPESPAEIIDPGHEAAVTWESPISRPGRGLVSAGERKLP